MVKNIFRARSTSATLNDGVQGEGWFIEGWTLLINTVCLKKFVVCEITHGASLDYKTMN